MVLNETSMFKSFTGLSGKHCMEAIKSEIQTSIGNDMCNKHKNLFQGFRCKREKNNHKGNLR